MRVGSLVAGCCWGVAVLAVTSTTEEMADRDRWLWGWLGRAGAETIPHVRVVYEDVSDAVTRGKSWRGTPFQLGERVYRQGLAFNASKKLRVQLGEPGESLNADVGLENNDDTRRGEGSGHGSVTFHVWVEGREVWSSPVLRRKDGGRAMAVPLGGAREFEMEVRDGGDGRGWDQALWAEPVVKLSGGGEVRVAELPLLEGGVAGVTASTPPLSLVFGGRAMAEWLAGCEYRQESRALDPQRTEHVLTHRDRSSGLEMRVVLIAYGGFPTVEWTAYFRNRGVTNTPILEQVQALDLGVTRRNQGEFLLRHHVGSPADGNDYGPLETTLSPGVTKRLGGVGGRPTNRDWSYANLGWGDAGLILAVGWPGQWALECRRDNARGLRLVAGQELTRFVLEPGEEVRTPLMVLQFYRGDWLRAQNLWRRWMMAHSMPKPGGRLPPPQLLASSSRQFDEMIGANETNQMAFIDRYREEGLGLDYWWMDAGWYVHHGGGWPRVGTWLVDSNRFPRGLRAVSDHAHEQGLKTLVWFEPERVAAGTWLAENHPEWIRGGAQGGLLDLGNAEARAWLIEQVDRLLVEQGIDLYRQDFNLDPLAHWRGADAPDRQGLAENRHVTGYLAFWDELRRRHPHLLIDACASGGRRNDLESMRRAVPLWRSDYAYEAIGHQGMMYGLSLWLPFHGTGTVGTRSASYYGSGHTPVEPYAFWSNAGQSLVLGLDVRLRDLDYARLRKLIAQWREVSPNYYGDFYPLTSWSRDPTLWMAWQFDRPEVGEGMVQVFRRHESFYETARLPLRALKAEQEYRVTRLEDGVEVRLRGSELMGAGLAVGFKEKPDSAVFRYWKQ